MARVLRLLLMLLGLLLLAGCGGAKNNGGVGASAANKPKGLVAEVSDPKAEETGAGVTASAKVKVGGLAGKKITLEYGLVDALLGSSPRRRRSSTAMSPPCPSPPTRRRCRSRSA